MSRGREDWVMQHMGFSNWDLGVVILNSTILITECLKMLIVLLKLVPNLQRIRIISKDAIIERVSCFINVLTLIYYTLSLHFLILVYLNLVYISISHLSYAVWVLFKIL
jgi:hypothetical protein